MKNPITSSSISSNLLPALAFFALVGGVHAQLTWDPDGDQIDNGGSDLWDFSSLSWDEYPPAQIT